MEEYQNKQLKIQFVLLKYLLKFKQLIKYLLYMFNKLKKEIYMDMGNKMFVKKFMKQKWK